MFVDWTQEDVMFFLHTIELSSFISLFLYQFTSVITILSRLQSISYKTNDLGCCHTRNFYRQEVPDIIFLCKMHLLYIQLYCANKPKRLFVFFFSIFPILIHSLPNICTLLVDCKHPSHE